MMIKTTPPRFGQKGFTLIEIVMVLVLLGILAAVAVPKYFDLEEQAKKLAAQTVEQELQARLDAEFAKGLLEGQSCQTFYLKKGNLKATAVTDMAYLLTNEYSQTSTNTKVTLGNPGDSEDGLTAPLLISLDGGLIGTYKYTGKIIFPSCMKDKK